MTTPEVTLPAWATFKAGKHRIPVIDVDADAMYTAWLAEIGEHYATHVPPEWKDEKGVLLPEWFNCLKELDPPSAYWLEVAYQCMKLDLQIAMRTFHFEIHVHDAKKNWAQKDAKPGRGTDKAAGGLQGGKEAREHFKRIRGVFPA